ncbi:chorismate--pyruvate lyase family protein [Avibacterium endocarditidis]|uniref:chorismate--pyruvate lyase family protein n=1 Tax=Avibacterium endocarditidis TaxID=380674 RepID=UPI002482F393|nr:chorismate lyase [Avibacterium endocarditidis]
MLKGDGTPWIFAQTTLPQTTVQNVAQYVLQLGEQPIGLWLFKQPMQRVSLYWQQDPKTGLYARYSDFDLKGYPLQIKELFLAEFPFPA